MEADDKRTLYLSRMAPVYNCNLFLVKDLSTDKLVYRSFSRRKVNLFLTEQLKKNYHTVEFDHKLPGKSLEYSFNYSPAEYLLGFLFYLAGGLLLAIYSDGRLAVVISITFFVLSGFCYYRYRNSHVFSKYL